MLGKVELVNGQKVITPISGTIAVDTVQSGNQYPVSSNAVQQKINSLDVSSVGGTNKYIKTISETDGKISATAGTVDTTVTSGSSNLVTSGAVFTAIQNAVPEADTYGTVSDGTLYLSKYGRIVKIDFVPSANERVNIGGGTYDWFEFFVNFNTSNIITSAWRPAYQQRIVENETIVITTNSAQAERGTITKHIIIGTDGNITVNYISSESSGGNKYAYQQDILRFSGFYMCASS